MGTYLNPGMQAFEEAMDSDIFVDKTEMLLYINTVVRTRQKYLSISRPRRFGKTMAADMLCAYYGRTADSRSLFDQCKISQGEYSHSDRQLSWDVYLGKFDVIRLVMTDFIRQGITVSESLEKVSHRILDELHELYPDTTFDEDDLAYSMDRFYRGSGIQFVIIIDEWDAIFREYKNDRDGQREYLDFLREWLKDKDYIALAYLTGILPIKKYGKHSALNMFREFSMTQPQQLASSMGFTAEEVQELCRKRDLDFKGFKKWYDGYRLSNRVSADMIPAGVNVDQTIYREYEIYSPYSVVNAMLSKQFANYWNQTETYEALQQYIEWNFDGLREDVAILMEGGRIRIDITGYQNDMTTFHSKDDILTMLIHLGYLGYDNAAGCVFIPNQEVGQVFATSTRGRDWTVTFKALENSQKLLESIWAYDEDTAAQLLEAAHDKAGNRTYNSEAALSYAVQLAMYSAQDLYTLIPEYDTGRGYADLTYIPKMPDKPAILIELKYDKSADTAIQQIHRQHYPDRLANYRGNIILVGIDYDRTISHDSPAFKHHSCRIEKA